MLESKVQIKMLRQFSALHLECLWRFFFALFHLVIHPCCHAPTHTAERDICHKIDERYHGIISLEIDANIQTRSKNCQTLQAIVASNKPDIVFIQSETVLSHDHALCGTDSHAWKAASLSAHAALWAALLPHVPRLNAATSTKHPLAAFVVRPSRPGFDVVERFVPKLILCAGEADHGNTPATWLGARGTAELDLELRVIVGILTPLNWSWATNYAEWGELVCKCLPNDINIVKRHAARLMQ